MWTPTHFRSTPHSEPDPRAPWQAAAAAVFILGLATLFIGGVQACAPSPQTPSIPPATENHRALTRDNPRLADFLTATSAQKHSQPVTYRPKTHLAHRETFRRHALTAALNHGWYPVPRPSSGNAPPTIFMVPQHDLPLLAALENDPITQIAVLSAAPPRDPSPGPLVKTRLHIDTYITPSKSSKALIAAGVIITILALAATWALTQPTATQRSN